MNSYQELVNTLRMSCLPSGTILDEERYYTYSIVAPYYVGLTQRGGKAKLMKYSPMLNRMRTKIGAGKIKQLVVTRETPDDYVGLIVRRRRSWFGIGSVVIYLVAHCDDDCEVDMKKLRVTTFEEAFHVIHEWIKLTTEYPVTDPQQLAAGWHAEFGAVRRTRAAALRIGKALLSRIGEVSGAPDFCKSYERYDTRRRLRSSGTHRPAE